MADTKKKALFLLTRTPFPANDGTKTKILFDVLDAAKKEYDCTLAIISGEKPDLAAIDHLKEHYGKVLYYYRSRFWRTAAGIMAWLCGRPVQVGYYYSRSTARSLAPIMESVDLVWAHTIRFGKYFENASGALQEKTLLDFNDAISFNYRTARAHARGVWRIVYWMEAERVARYEKRMLSDLRHFSIVSEADKAYLAAPDSVRIAVIPHGVPDSFLEYKNTHNGTDDAVVIGNNFYPPNFDGVVWFSQIVANYRRNRGNAFRYDVLGNYPDALKALCPAATFAGFVADPYPFVLSHIVFVAPLRFGAGVPTKILEAMALGMPVITTPEGARGITGARDGEHLFIRATTDVQGWYTVLDALSADKALRERIGNNARQLIREHYTTSVAQARFLAVAKEIV